jgi:hypothetical protein
VDVGVLEAWNEEPTGQVDDPRARANLSGDLGGRPDGGNLLAADGDGFGPWPASIDGVDVAAGEDEIGV